MAVVNSAFNALTLLVGRQEGHPACKKTEWWGAGVVVSLERGADLHTAQLMPLPLTVSCFGKIQIGFTFLIPAHLGSPGQRAVKRVCVAAVVNSSTQFVTAVWIVLNLTAASLDAGFCCCGRTAIFWRTSVTSWKQFDTRRTTLRTSLPADNRLPTLYTHARTERHCADTIGTVPVPCGLAVSNAKILTHFSIKIYGSNFITKSTRKLLRFEITKMLIAV